MILIMAGEMFHINFFLRSRIQCFKEKLLLSDMVKACSRFSRFVIEDRKQRCGLEEAVTLNAHCSIRDERKVAKYCAHAILFSLRYLRPITAFEGVL